MVPLRDLKSASFPHRNTVQTELEPDFVTLQEKNVVLMDPLRTINTPTVNLKVELPHSSSRSSSAHPWALNSDLSDQSLDALLDLFIALLLKKDNKRRSVETKTRVPLRRSAGPLKLLPVLAAQPGPMTRDGEESVGNQQINDRVLNFLFSLFLGK